VWFVKRLIFLIVLLVAVPAVHAEVFTRVCLGDGNTSLELADPCIPFVYRPIMVGTHLTIIINSDMDGSWENGGELSIWDTNQNYGVLSGRDYNDETLDWQGSRFPVAGDMAVVWDFAETEVVDGLEHDAKGFRLYGDDDAIAGDWFIIDYNAINVGFCSVNFYDRSVDEDKPLYKMSLTQVRTRDFNNDGIVNFEDFAVFGLNWRRTNCSEPEDCSGTDLDTDGHVDISDLMQFAEYWLEKTR
jgi:hypothetical protein